MFSTAIMVIWIGFGQTQSISITKFKNIQECNVAKEVILKNYNRTFARIDGDNINCFEIK